MSGRGVKTLRTGEPWARTIACTTANAYLTSFTQRVWAVTPADQRIATSYLDPNKSTIAVAGGRKQTASRSMAS